MNLNEIMDQLTPEHDQIIVSPDVASMLVNSGEPFTVMYHIADPNWIGVIKIENIIVDVILDLNSTGVKFV